MKARLCRLIIPIVLFSLGAGAADISISASVDRDAIALDEVLTYTVTIEGTRDFPDVPPPTSDGFVIISGPSQSSSIQIVNGAVSASKTIQWRLAPTRTGRQTIEPVEIKYRRKRYRTPAITVSVGGSRKQSSTPPATSSQGARSAPRASSKAVIQDGVFLRAEVPKTTIYKGEELTVSFNLYFQNVRNYAPQKMPDAKGFWTEAFPEKRNPTVSTTVVDGVTYKKATLRRLALFPTTTGDLIIDPMEISCEVPVRRQRRRSVFDDFFDDPFFNDPFFGSTKTVHVRSEPVTIHVKELPAAGCPSDFSGAVGNFVIESQIDTLQTVQNQALTLRYTISGSGNINAIRLPSLNLPATVEVFEPKVDRKVNNQGKSIRGTVTFEYVLIPRSSGTLRIPALSFSYFDPAGARYRKVTASGYRVDVRAATVTDTGSRSGFNKEEISLLGSDIRFIMRDNPRWQPIGSSVFSRPWFWIFNLLALVVAGGSLAVRRWMDQMARDSLFARRRRALSRAQQTLKQAQEAFEQNKIGQLAGLLERAVAGFVADRLGLPSGGLGPQDVTQALQRARADAELVTTVGNFLRQLEEERFLPGQLNPESASEKLQQAREILSKLTKAI